MRIWLLLFLSVLIIAPPTCAQETITTAASSRYTQPFVLEKTLVGTNYRDIWSQPVAVRVFHLDKEKGGFKIGELGGGMQTKSLRLQDKTGQEWVLRSIDKSVDKAMQATGIKNKYLRQFSQQMISAAHPYGPLTMVPMAKALGILSTEPEVFYVPDDPAFGEHRSLFANTMCLLEKREPVFHEGDKVISTDKLIKHLKKDKEYQLDQKMLLQARLLDMLVGDWDRHGDQWKWDVHKQPDGTKMVYPIPRDHDQAYFNSTGFVFETVRLFNLHAFVGFRESLKLKALNYKEWDFDHSLLKDLTEEDWRSGAQTFQAKLTDEVLAAGVRRLPPEVYALHADKMLRTLKVRRDKMPEAVVAYYHFLQENPKKVEKARLDMESRAKKAKGLKGLDEAANATTEKE